MKAKQDFVYFVNEKNIPTPFKSGEDNKGIREIKIRKGEEIPKEIESDILMFNKELIDLEYKEGKPVVPEELKNIKSPPLLEKRKYDREGLIKTYNEKGMKGLKEIGESFNPPITDKSKDKLITEILTAQERIRRTGK